MLQGKSRTNPVNCCQPVHIHTDSKIQYESIFFKEAIWGTSRILELYDIKLGMPRHDAHAPRDAWSRRRSRQSRQSGSTSWIKLAWLWYVVLDFVWWSLDLPRKPNWEPHWPQCQYMPVFSTVKRQEGRLWRCCLMSTDVVLSSSLCRVLTGKWDEIEHMSRVERKVAVWFHDIPARPFRLMDWTWPHGRHDDV